jgi:adenine-specific DNA-methyltransferase
MSNQKHLGQYFTKNVDLQKKVYEFIYNNPETILEPSVGRGDLVKYITKFNSKIKFQCYEIDKALDFIINTDCIIFENFLKVNIKNNYKTIIGNPPYVRTKKGNLYIDFINKCIDILEENGELIFIIPSDFFKLTSAIKTIKKMMDNGTITHIYHPQDENLFENASIDVIIFRYCKNKKLEKKVLYNDELLYIIESGGLLSFSESKNDNKIPINQLFNVYVGMVTGKESVYKNEELGNIKLLNGENKINGYIYLIEFPSRDDKINKYILKNKKLLISRKIKKFNELNWFQWGAPRNTKVMEEKKNKECIYVKNLTRKKKIAFKSKVMYFGGSLLMLLPKEEDLCLDNIVKILNKEETKKNYMYANRFKIGHRQLSSLLIEFN